MKSKNIPTALRTWIPVNGWGYTDFMYQHGILSIIRVALMEAFQTQADYIRYQETIEVKTSLQSILKKPNDPYSHFCPQKCLEIMQKHMDDNTAIIHSDRKYGIVPNLK